MQYREINPGEPLKRYVKCYYIYESETASAFDDIVFPSGCPEMIFNLGTGQWLTNQGQGFETHPSIELWGQITQPLPVRSMGTNTMLGVRFFPHSAACFLREKMDLFNNQVLDLGAISGRPVQLLYERLQETGSWDQRIEIVEAYLLNQLSLSEQNLGKITVISNVMNEFRSTTFFDNIDNVASRYGISARYLQKLFLQYTGLTPKLYNKVNRFQHSLRLITEKETSLTSVAYDCGYFDQSHFIREFKSFTGLTPSAYATQRSPITRAVVEE